MPSASLCRARYAQGEPAWDIQPQTLEEVKDLSLNFFFILPLLNQGGQGTKRAAQGQKKEANKEQEKRRERERWKTREWRLAVLLPAAVRASDFPAPVPASVSVSAVGVHTMEAPSLHPVSSSPQDSDSGLCMACRTAHVPPSLPPYYTVACLSGSREGSVRRSYDCIRQEFLLPCCWWQWLQQALP